MDLEATLARVSHNFLRGQPVPADLRALWDARLRDDAGLLDGLEVLLLDEGGTEFLDGYGAVTGAAPAVARAHRRMFEHIAFFALTMNDGLLGYWLGEENRPVRDGPVVELDGEGQYRLRGTSAAEYLLLFSDDPGDFALVRDWLAGHGIPVGVHGPQEILDKLGGFTDPYAVAQKYLQEEQAKGD